MTVKSDMDVSFGDAHAGGIDLGVLKSLVGDIPDDVKEKQRQMMHKLMPYGNMKIEKFSPRVE